MVNTPEIKTERLILRKFTADDAGAFFAIMSDREVNAFLPVFLIDTKEEAAEFLRENYLERYDLPLAFRYAVCLKTDSIPIGYVVIDTDDSYDLGYGLLPEYWHQGIATEACTALFRQVEQAGIPYVTATHDVKNPRSGGVMRNIGMTYRYSYEELWRPKNIVATFRMYQRNFDGRDDRVYLKYWDKYPVHFVEKEI